MRKTPLLIGLTVLLWGTAVAFGQNNSWVAPCEPSLCNPCDPCGHSTASSFNFGGWLEMGIYTNSHGSKENGPMHTDSNRRTDFLMNQLYVFGEKEMNTRRGFDWGARVDFAYGVDGPNMQCFGDETFDRDLGTNKHGYGLAVYNLYGRLGYKDLTVTAGKFTGRVGWEGSASKDNFFYSHSYCYWIEPATHMGVIADYNLTDRLSIAAGWVTGADSSFKNPTNGQTILTGFEYALADNANVYYYINAGKQNYDLDDPATTYDYFVQSVCLEWDVTKRFTYVMQYNLRNDNQRGGSNTNAYGINNHFLYTLNKQWKAGMRFEWLRDNGGHFGEATQGDYYQLTWGLNWEPYKNVSIRPEVRYDWCKGAAPFADSTKSDQISGGFGMVLSF